MERCLARKPSASGLALSARTVGTLNECPKFLKSTGKGTENEKSSNDYSVHLFLYKSEYIFLILLTSKRKFTKLSSCFIGQFPCIVQSNILYHSMGKEIVE